jgi:ribosomal protein L20A (L18A)
MAKNYRVTGSFQMGSKKAHFAKDFAVESPQKAREHAYSEFGSRHHVKRREIWIEKVEEVKATEATRGRSE